VVRQLRVRPGFVQIRHYSTGNQPPGPSLVELIGNTVSALRNLLWAPTAVEQITAQTPLPVLPAQPPLPKPPKQSNDPWAGESTWVAIDKNGGRHSPGTIDWLYRSHDVQPEVLFRDGMPAPGDDFDLKRHQQRTTQRTGTDDAFYGACDRMAWQGSDSGDWDGPAFDMTNRYMSVIKDAYGLGIENQLNVSIVELESVVHMVPPHKIVAVFDKQTGAIHLNRTAPKELADEVTDRLRKLWIAGLRRGIYTEPENS
jgi:hypothetical protein